MSDSPALRAGATDKRRLQAGLCLVADVQDAFALCCRGTCRKGGRAHSPAPVYIFSAMKVPNFSLVYYQLARLSVAVPKQPVERLDLQSVQPVGCCPGSSVLPCRRFAEACELRGTSGHSSASGLWLSTQRRGT